LTEVPSRQAEASKKTLIQSGHGHGSVWLH
jgi:hypothetical protein